MIYLAIPYTHEDPPPRACPAGASAEEGEAAAVVERALGCWYR